MTVISGKVQEAISVKNLERPGVRLVYRYLAGTQANKTPLVLVHGWAGSAEDWHNLLEPCMSRSESVLVYDAAGFGQSQFENKAAAVNFDYSLEHYVEDLQALLVAEGLERVRLVGHSWGGVVAMSFAARYPAQVESLVAIGSAYFDPHKTLHQILKWASFLIAWAMILTKPLLRRSARLRKLAVRRYFYRSVSEAEIELLLNDALEANNRAIVQTLLTGYAVQFKTICPTLKCPVLYVGSERDVVAPLPYVKAFVPLTPYASFTTIQACGHFPMLEQPTELVKVLDDFWQSIV